MRRVLCAIVLFALATSIGWSGGTPPARAIIDKAIAAGGGEEKLAKFQTATMDEKGTFYGMGDGIEYTGKYALERPDKFRMEIQGVFIMVLNGDKGWIQSGGTTNEMKKEQIASEQFNHKAGWMMSLLPLKDKAYTLKSAGSAKVGNVETNVVVVSRKDYPTVKMYFDKKTSHLIKSEFKSKAADMEFKEVVMEYAFSDHRTVEGATMPHKFEIKRDGKKFVEAEHTMKAVKEHPAKTFDRPAD